MADRDSNSVPVTTLAGLTNLSDLLSELPITENTSLLSSLNLLFHPRVAEEAKNLLAVKDDNLVRSLVYAIEQTNADHIELKPNYAEANQLTGTNINELPSLLQAIHSLKATVFKTGSQQQQRQPSHTNSMQTHHHQTMQVQQTLDQQHQPYQDNQNVSSMGQQNFYHQQLQSTNALQSSQSDQLPSYVPLDQYNNASSSHIQNATNANYYSQLQEPNQFYSTGLENSGQMPGTSTSSVITNQWNQIHQQQQLHQQQQVQKIQMDLQDSYSNIQRQQNQTAAVSNFNSILGDFPNSVQQSQGISSDSGFYQTTQNMVEPQNQHLGQIDVFSQVHQTSHDIIGIQQPSSSASNQIPVQSQAGGSIQQQIYNSNHMQSLVPPNNTYPMQTQQFQAPSQSQSFNSLNQQTAASQYSSQGISDFDQLKHSQNSPSGSYINHINSSGGVGSGVIGFQQQAQPQQAQSRADFNSVLQMASRKKLEQSKINSSLGPTIHNSHSEPAPNSSQSVYNSTDGEIVNDQYLNSESHIAVNVKRMSPQTIEKLSTDGLSKYSEELPEKAKNLGIYVDPFSRLRDEGLPNRKRNHDGKDDEGELFSQPKLRRVEKIVDKNMKSKDNVQKSHTYIQFMKNMENELKRLEMEPLNNCDDDLDDNPEYRISSRMLTTFTSDIAKLNGKRALDQVPKNKLTLLVNYAMRSIYLGRKFSLGSDIELELLPDDVMYKVLDGVEACLMVCSIYSTASDVKFMQEDNMEAIVKFVQFQLRETIYPTFDPVYSVKSVKKNSKKQTQNQNLSRTIQLIYGKLVDIMKLFVTLFDNSSFVDTIELVVSSMAVEPFFVDNVENLQFACLELVTTFFRKEKYSKYRGSILNDILSSVNRLTPNKKNLRPYKLSNHGGSIQMITALILQLIQCATVLPHSSSNSSHSASRKRQFEESLNHIDSDLTVTGKFQTALSIGGNFLQAFLEKCKPRSGETDFRGVFENLIQDLLETANRPEWPASELLLSLLGTLLVKYIEDKKIDQTIRVASLEYLGIVASRLRKDTVESRCKVSTMDKLIKCIKQEQEKMGDIDKNDSPIELDPEEERTEFLQKILLDFLAVNAHEDNLLWDYARNFYITQWYRDIVQRKKRIAAGEKGYASRKKIHKRKRRHSESEEDDSFSEDDDDDDDEPRKTTTIDQDLNLEIFRLLEARKRYLINKVSPYSRSNTNEIKTYIDYSNAHLIAQYLASKRQFIQSFDTYLNKIILVVREPAIAIRTKAMKCLAMIVEVDPSILRRRDMQAGVQQKFLDTAISVREAAVDLVGKFILSSPDLINQYYDMLSQRILDTGVSVRKRVIKILRDICIEYPDFGKIPEICVKMIKRVNDEEGIQKLVTEVFMRMWFTPCPENDSVSIKRKIIQMGDVVSMAQDTGTQWLQGLLQSIFAPKVDKNEPLKVNAPKPEPPKEVIQACQQIADGLVNEIIRLGTSNPTGRLFGCITTLHLLSKARPQLLINHATSLEPYLHETGKSQAMVKFICCIAEILELVVPLMNHPSEAFLSDLELHLMLLVIQQPQVVVLSSLSCLGAIINNITKNFKLIRDCFQQYYSVIVDSREIVRTKGDQYIQQIYHPKFRRGLCIVGITCRYFDLKSPLFYRDSSNISVLPSTVCDDVFEALLFFAMLNNNNLRREALTAMGHYCTKNYEYLTNHKLKDFYCHLLTSSETLNEIKTIVLRNILQYLNDADESMEKNEKRSASHTDNLKEMGDISSGMASRIIQLYLKEVLNCFLNKDFTVRHRALSLVQAVLRQGLVHPVQIVPYLICISTDPRAENARRADTHLQEIEKQYPGFVNMKSMAGIQLSYEFQGILQMHEKNNLVRGYRINPNDGQPSALNSFLYTIFRLGKPQRRALVLAITKQFVEQKTTLTHKLYLADNLAYFPYVQQDEPLYLVNQIDLLISTAGTNLLAAFKDNLKHPVGDGDQQLTSILDEDDDDVDDIDVDSLLDRLPEDTTDLQNCIISAQGCILLLMLKQHLKDSYGLTDSKIAKYSPSDSSKIFDKAVQRKNVPAFTPKTTIQIIGENQAIGKLLDEKERRELLERYVYFKKLMIEIDKETSSDNEFQTPVKSAKLNDSVHTDDVIMDTPNYTNNSHRGGGNDASEYHQDPLSIVVNTKEYKSSPTKSSGKHKKVSKSSSKKSKRRRHKITTSSEEESSDYSDGNM